MKPHDPPTPLADADSPPLLRDALFAARAERPAPDAIARLAARLPLTAPIPGPAGAATSAPVLSGALVGAALGALVLGGLLWPTAPARPVAAVASNGAGAVSASPPPLPLSAVASEEPPPVPEARRAPGARAVLDGGDPQTPATGVLDGGDPQTPATGVAASAAPPAAPAPSASAPAAPSEPPTSWIVIAEVPGTARAAPTDADAEARLLRRAQDALGPNPALAFALAQEHARRFPRGRLGQQRELLAIRALARLGRASDARARAVRFLAAFPGAAQRRRVEAALGP
jgi:hypothetical protein